MRHLFKILILPLVLLISLPSYSQMAIEDQSVFLDSVLLNLFNTDDVESSIAILDEQISLKSSIIDKLKYQIVQIDKDIHNNELYYGRLNTLLERDKSIYADLLVKAQLYHSRVYHTYDIFSLDNLYTAYRQFLYMKYLADYRKKKIRSIKNLKEEIVKVVSDLDSIRQIKSNIAQKLGVEQSFINKYSSSRSSIIKDLNNKNNKLNSNITRNNLDSIKFVESVSSDSINNVSSLFQIQRGYLLWPVKKAAIIGYFGEKPHPVYDNVTVKNDGIDFCIPSTSVVSSVYQGRVAKITTLPHSKFVVIIQHGEYYTVYNGLDIVKVKLGEIVDKGENIGSFDSDESHSILNFQIWKGAESLDPSLWLLKSKNKK